MQLGEVMCRAPAGAADVEVSALAYDNRTVTPGTLFFCVPGFQRDGHDFAPDAVARGAAALVVQRPLGLSVPEIVVEDVRAEMALAAARFHGDPSAALDVVGVTGTNGKTTTAYLVRALLEADGRPCGLLGTVTSVIGGHDLPVARTTPEAIELQRLLAGMRAAGDRACAMEVSSHALSLHRADAIHFAVAIFTNITRDHLDFHPTMEDYFAAKRRLLDNPLSRVRVINIDDPYGARLAGDFPDAITVALESRTADYRLTRLDSGLRGSSFDLATPDGPLSLRSPLPGRFNVANVLGAVAAVRALGVAADTIAAALPSAGRVPGRFEPIEEGQPFAVLVDYAHTPDSLENVLRAARDLISATGQGRVICVFGAGGDRDRGKRPLMGEIASRLADLVIVTSDNPRSEDPAGIVAEIVAGAGRAVEVEVDRRAAIARSVAAGQAGDVVVIAGKGHEQGQEFANGHKLPFDDAAVAREALRRLGPRAAAQR
ncbi:MAG: UDP-N-acetylmuramoyl-L-alanyl-D-glutamate--2,6-diaminopimelate ligase [Solirubrobacteraceae bacterium]|nr:MAG: UDP-N-acetylmuramoyl-L-alanyl-D-glutamate--2,6-diaminopimelate ligase [Solirubrobacterales bacterium]